MMGKQQQQQRCKQNKIFLPDDYILTCLEYMYTQKNIIKL